MHDSNGPSTDADTDNPWTREHVSYRPQTPLVMLTIMTTTMRHLYGVACIVGDGLWASSAPGVCLSEVSPDCLEARSTSKRNCRQIGF